MISVSIRLFHTGPLVSHLLRVRGQIRCLSTFEKRSVTLWCKCSLLSQQSSCKGFNNLTVFSNLACKVNIPFDYETDGSKTLLHEIALLLRKVAYSQCALKPEAWSAGFLSLTRSLDGFVKRCIWEKISQEKAMAGLVDTFTQLLVSSPSFSKLPSTTMPRSKLAVDVGFYIHSATARCEERAFLTIETGVCTMTGYHLISFYTKVKTSRDLLFSPCHNDPLGNQNWGVRQSEASGPIHASGNSYCSHRM